MYYVITEQATHQDSITVHYPNISSHKFASVISCDTASLYAVTAACFQNIDIRIFEIRGDVCLVRIPECQVESCVGLKLVH